MIENLDCLVSLQELSLENNLITSIPPLNLPKLEDLRLSGNKISELKQLQTLGSYKSLEEVTFSGGMYEACPIGTQEGYRDFVTFHLPKIKKLDGIPIKEHDKQAVNNYAT